ncbi:TPA: hypothetical protein ACGXGE_005595 [Bacillus pacificus]
MIDKNTYFRNNLFGGLSWSWETPTKEVAIATFTIDLFGVSLGSHNLTISHNLTRIAGQGNVPTVLHWGHNVGSALQASDYRGFNLEMYQDSPTHFYIKIYR